MKNEELNKILTQADINYEILKDMVRESKEWQKMYLEEKEKNDKAIEYIEKEKSKDEEDNFIDLYLDKYESDLLNILKGEDK